MTIFHLLKELRTNFNVSNNAKLALKLNTHHAVLSRLQTKQPKELSAEFLVRCHDYAGYSIQKTRDLYNAPKDPYNKENSS